MAPTDSLKAVKKACKNLRLDKVPPGAWSALRQADLDLGVGLGFSVAHVSAAHLQHLAAALEAACCVGAELWEWLALPARSPDEEAGEYNFCPRARALLALLAQASTTRVELAGVAGAAYLTLLLADGAERQWSLLFEPSQFRQVLQTLRCLRQRDLLRRRERSDAGKEVSAEGRLAAGDDEAEDSEDEGSGSAPLQEATELLGKLQAFLLARGLGAFPEVIHMVVDELGALLVRPANDDVARLAAAGLAALVAHAGSPDGVRRTAIATLRTAMTAVLMIQERNASLQGALPRRLVQVRATALNFVCGLVRSHPELLLFPRFTALSLSLEEGNWEEPPTKRARVRGKDRAASADDEEELEDSADAAGDRRTRRRRPAGKATDDALVAMLELMCVLTPDRAEWRGYAAESVITLLCEAAHAERTLSLPGATSAMPHEDGSAAGLSGGVLVAASSGPARARATTCERFLEFLERILENERASFRATGTHIAVGFLERSGELAARGATQDAPAALVKKLLWALVRRSADSVATVRGKALGGVATALQFLGRSDRGELLRRILLIRADPQYVDVAGLFRVAAVDEKATVRRAALSLMDATVRLLHSAVQLDTTEVVAFFDLSLMVSLAADESPIVRKACVSTLALLLRTCHSPQICELWIRNALPLVLDVEVIVAERALDEVEAAVLNPITEHAAAAGVSGLAEGLPAVLNYLDSEATEYLQRALRLIAKRNEGTLPQGFVDALAGIVKECLRPLPLREWPFAAWSMIEELTSIENVGAHVIEFELVHEAWVLFIAPAAARGGVSGDHLGRVGASIICILEHLIDQAPKKSITGLMDSLCGALASFSAPPSLIRGMMSAVARIEQLWTETKYGAQQAGRQTAWRAALERSIHDALSNLVRGNTVSDDVGKDRLCACLFTLGELAIIDTSNISESVTMQVQTIATNTILHEGRRVNSEPAVRGHAFATLGKLCLKKADLAKKCVELMVIHLNENESFIVRNNVLLALGDIGAHYTSLVERFVPCMTVLMRDDNELVRKQAAMVLSSLLCEDFIKLRGPILLRFLYALSDPCLHVRRFVEGVFVRILHKRNSAIFSQNFLDAICALNGWTGLTNFQGAAGNDGFCLRKLQPRRVMIYRFMLALMTNAQKFSVCEQLVKTLLAAFADTEEKLCLPKSQEEPAGQALKDGLALLCCEEMRICFSTPASAEVEAEGASSRERAAAEAARGVLSSILKRNMCENVVPILIQLKNRMERGRSPFLGQLRYCLREILRDFKEDLPVMLAGDPQLAREVAFDLQEKEVTHGNDEAGKSEMLLPIARATRAKRKSLDAVLNARPTTFSAPLTPILDEALCQDTVHGTVPKARRGLPRRKGKQQCGGNVVEECGEASAEVKVRRRSARKLARLSGA